MSLYNGFPTHEQEQKYYTLIRYLVLVLQKRLLRFYQGQPCNQKKFISILSKLRSRISKLENNKYSQPKFADSLLSFLREVKPQQKQKLKKLGSFQTQSMTSNNDLKSQLSLDFSFDRLPTVTKLYSLPRENIPAYRLQRHNYHSFQSMKNTPVIAQSQQWQHNDSHRLSRASSNQYRQLQIKLRQPKLTSYIDKIRKEAKMLQIMSKKNQKQSSQTGQNYLGQRRKKNKKMLRAYQVS